MISLYLNVFLGYSCYFCMHDGIQQNTMRNIFMYGVSSLCMYVFRYGVMHGNTVVCHHILSCCIYTVLVSLIFGNAIPTSFNKCFTTLVTCVTPPYFLLWGFACYYCCMPSSFVLRDIYCTLALQSLHTAFTLVYMGMSTGIQGC